MNSERGSSPLERRSQNIKVLEKDSFDLLVIGGGITGVGIARDAVIRGLKVALIEKNDLASGTSSQSSKLLHGGVRYLEQWAFGLVRESIRERDNLAENAAHLARPLPFIFPIYDQDKYGPMLINMGMWLYSAFAMFRSDRRHTMLSVEELKSREPNLMVDGIRGATLYYDCMTDDGRLTLENAIDARDRGAVIVTRISATEVIKNGDQVEGVLARDELKPSSEPFPIQAKMTVSATGPWTDKLLSDFKLQEENRLRPTKGVHIVVDKARLPARHSVVMRSTDDKRVLFTIPWGERTVIGTTDTDDVEGPDACRATGSDVDYLIRAARHYFPEFNLTRKDVISTWAGLRPLLRTDGVDPSAVSREHEIIDVTPGLIAIFGGKLTTYRMMAEEVVDQTDLTSAKCQTGDIPLPGSMTEAMRKNPLSCGRNLASIHKLPPDIGEHLALAYGDRATQLLALGEELSVAPERMIPDLPYIWPELLFAARHEMAISLEDILRRRLMIALKDKEQGLEIVEKAADLVAPEFGWTDEQKAAEVQRYRDFIASTRQFRNET
ncbi:MAG: glycerol-3-phosphate dehydrogenase/oxidase [Planctomycetota bacterium]|nr:glycerol-3-phosphate dehydrogenase/oxidase [Planctomycetota bacterium]